MNGGGARAGRLQPHCPHVPRSRRGHFPDPQSPTPDRTDVDSIHMTSKEPNSLLNVKGMELKFLSLKAKVLHHLTQICLFQPLPTVIHLASQASECLTGIFAPPNLCLRPSNPMSPLGCLTILWSPFPRLKTILILRSHT